MAESLQHHGLVSRAAQAVREALHGHGRFSCFVDGPPPSDGQPPAIDGYRPDLYATTQHVVVVGEAKPPWDVETRRSEYQLRAFLRYVEKEPWRHMVFAVHWTTAATARSVLRSYAFDWSVVRSRVHILDGRYILTLPVHQNSYVKTD